MLAKTRDGFLILEYLADNGTVSKADLQRWAALSDEEWDSALLYLLQGGYVKSTLGRGGILWITEKGTKHLEDHLSEAIGLGLAAKRVLRFVGARESDTELEVRAEDIGDQLVLPKPELHHILVELLDKGLIEELLGRREHEFYTVRSTATGRELLRRGFRPERATASRRVNIGTVIGSMSGGTVQGVAQATNSQLTQTVNDPAAMAKMLDSLSNELVDAVREELSASGQLQKYYEALEDLRSEVLSDKPSESRIKRFVRLLGLLGDIEGSLGLTTRVLVPLGLYLAKVVAWLRQAAG